MAPDCGQLYVYPPMQIRVRLLRRRGHRLSMRTSPINADRGILCVHCIVRRNAPYLVAQLNRHGHPVDSKLIELFEPALVGAGNGAFRLRGVERADGAAVLQEWICEVARG